MVISYVTIIDDSALCSNAILRGNFGVNSAIINNIVNNIVIQPEKSFTSLSSLFLSNSRSLINKIDELSGTVSNLSADIVVITETWLSPAIDNAVINLSGYTTLRRDRSGGRRGRGVCVYTKNCLPIIHLKDLSKPQFETLWLLIQPSRLPRGLNSIILGAIYHPPRNDDRTLSEHITKSLDQALSSYPGSGVICQKPKDTSQIVWTRYWSRSDSH